MVFNRTEHYNRVFAILRLCIRQRTFLFPSPPPPQEGSSICTGYGPTIVFPSTSMQDSAVFSFPISFCTVPLWAGHVVPRKVPLWAVHVVPHRVPYCELSISFLARSPFFYSQGPAAIFLRRSSTSHSELSLWFRCELSMSQGLAVISLISIRAWSNWELSMSFRVVGYGMFCILLGPSVSSDKSDPHREAVNSPSNTLKLHPKCTGTSDYLEVSCRRLWKLSWRAVKTSAEQILAFEKIQLPSELPLMRKVGFSYTISQIIVNSIPRGLFLDNPSTLPDGIHP